MNFNFNLLMKHQSLFNRLRRIEGQIRGIEDMVAKDKSEQEILIQLEAANSSLSSATVSLIESLLEEQEGKTIIPSDQAKTILRILRK